MNHGTRTIALMGSGLVVLSLLPLSTRSEGAQADSRRGVNHWAYRAPRRHAIPNVTDIGWPRNAIDSFVLARLEAEGLRPSPEADRATLIRRVSLDLTGLPPTVEDVDAFLADGRPHAYERLVDRLLGSSSYGEQMARGWLDLARYADSNGYHIDTKRSIWPYRDWVINALNMNMSFDRFTIEQIAGDLLPNATRDQIVATGFHRNTMFNEEGGIDNEEFRAKAVADRVSTTMTTWMGTTMACAECHEHKYDPFTQEEFYGLYAFFNNVPERGGGTNTSRAPLLELTTVEQQKRLDAIRGEIAMLKKEADAKASETAAAQIEWEREIGSDLVRWTVLEPAGFLSAGGAALDKQNDKSLKATGNQPETDSYTVVAVTKVEKITAVRVEVLPDKSLPKSGPGRHDNGNAVLSEFRLTAAPKADPTAAKPVKLQSSSADFSQDGWPVASAIDGNARTGWAIAPEVGRAHRAVFETAEPVGASGGTTLTFRLDQYYGAGATVGRFRLAVTTAPRPIRHGHLPDSVVAILSTPADQRTDKQKKGLAAYFRETQPEARRIDDRLAELARAEKEVLQVVPTTLVMKEMDKPRVTKVHIRGNFLTLGEVVSAGVPAVLHPLSAGSPVNRLGLATWLIDPDNPLVGRVTMNRFWAHHFGRGIVATGEDFGTQGARPTHPGLLDWLATEFVRCDWDMKAMHRLIVTSATYRQSSHVDASRTARDPDNRLLARGPRFRLSAEALRDNALAISGLLCSKIGGPSVFPYQPAGLWTEKGLIGYGMTAWMASTGADLYRRGLYTFLRRSVPYPTFFTFDAPSREYCAAARARTNTPLQALTTLNDPAFVEAARAFAERILRDRARDDRARLGYALRLCVARSPSEVELDVLNKLLVRQRAHYGNDPAAARAMIRHGQSPPPEEVEPTELAAWTVVANALLNLDETITRP